MPVATASRPLMVCADDFGLSDGVDQAIAGLVRAGRLQAFSCLSNAPRWAADAHQVAALRQRAQAGLHFNLTEGRPLSAALAARWPLLPALPRLLALAHAGARPLHALRDELAAQWAAFADAAGAAPDYLDGHQHVHHLPGVRALVLDWLRSRPLPVRSTGELRGTGYAVKRWLIERSGGRALARALRRQGLPHNRVLLGCYDFQAGDYRSLVRGWLAQVPADGALLFCHPGRSSSSPQPDDGSEAADPIAAARQRELAYLAGAEFTQDLAAAGVVLSPAWPVVSTPGRVAA